MKFKFVLFIFLFFALVGCASAKNIPAAGGYTISSPGVYDLTGNISAVGTGLTNNADNVIVYGHGYTVFYENSGWGCGFLGISTHTNVTLRDINFVCANGSYTDGSAIYCTAINKMSIINCTGSTSAGHGIALLNSQNSIISNCIGVTNGSAGIGIYAMNDINLTIRDSIGSYIHPTLTGNGIFVYNTTYTNISKCKGSSVIGFGSYLEDCPYSNVSNISGTSQNESGLSFLNCNYSNITDSTGSSHSRKAIRLMSSSCCNMTGCNGLSILDNGLYFESSTNNTISECSCSSITAAGILLGSSTTNNTFSLMTISSPVDSAPHPSKHIMAVGDSITYLGYGVYTNNTLNGVNPTWHFLNRGVSGEQSSAGAARLLQELEIYNPQYILIMYGTNDIYKSVPQATIISNILGMAATAKRHNVTPYILLTTPSVGDSLKIQLNNNLSNAAITAGYKVINTWDSIDMVPLNGFNDSYNSSNYIDSDHPNDVGNQLLGTYVAKNFMRTSEFNSFETSGSAPLKVQFSDRSPYATSWSWDFENDGKIDSNKTNPVHTYRKAGSYSVNLTVHNEYGSFSTVKTDYIIVSDQTKPGNLDHLWKTLKHYLGRWLLTIQEAS
jgi:parallel beta-helix repeat protein